MIFIKDIAKIVNAKETSFLPKCASESLVNTFCYDSRQVTPGSVFVCIKGEHSDGHLFAREVASKGAALIIAERVDFVNSDFKVPVIHVENSVRAINELAAYRRSKTDAKVIGITGTAGKTSVKDVLASVLSKKGITGKNRMNLNSQIGLPISILNIKEDAVFWVLEAGINQPHDMDELGAVLRPDIAVILNVGAGHLSGLGDKGVAYHKARLLAYTSNSGTSVISKDYPDLTREAAVYSGNVTTFSYKDKSADFFVEYLGSSGPATGQYIVQHKGKSHTLLAPFRGEYGAENVGAIVAAATFAGMTIDEIAQGLLGVALPAQRFACRAIGKYTIIDDSYNANPLSTRRMIEAAKEIAEDRGTPLVLILGEMLELGDSAKREHEMLSECIAESKAIGVLWKGNYGDEIKSHLTVATEFENISNASEMCSGAHKLLIKHDLASCGAVFLFKGSRGNKLEECVSAFCEEVIQF